MTKFIVYERFGELAVRLQLVPCGRSVKLVAVNAEGQTVGDILSIDEFGLHRHPHAKKVAGVLCDSDGRISLAE